MNIRLVKIARTEGMKIMKVELWTGENDMDIEISHQQEERMTDIPKSQALWPNYYHVHFLDSICK